MRMLMMLMLMLQPASVRGNPPGEQTSKERLVERAVVRSTVVEEDPLPMSCSRLAPNLPWTPHSTGPWCARWLAGAICRRVPLERAICSAREEEGPHGLSVDWEVLEEEEEEEEQGQGQPSIPLACTEKISLWTTPATPSPSSAVPGDRTQMVGTPSGPHR